ncbi:MAG: hypothetical protein QOJ50_1627 [Cryptosporangiaceae bacterium]|nr:hypothetical protein [Cryptosporangiaceae bacterium]
MSPLFSPLTPCGTPIRNRTGRRACHPTWPLAAGRVPGNDVARPPQYPRAPWGHGTPRPVGRGTTKPRPAAGRDQAEAVPP